VSASTPEPAPLPTGPAVGIPADPFRPKVALGPKAAPPRRTESWGPGPGPLGPVEPNGPPAPVVEEPKPSLKGVIIGNPSLAVIELNEQIFLARENDLSAGRLRGKALRDGRVDLIRIEKGKGAPVSLKSAS